MDMGFKTLDGRIDGEYFGTPGGDSGEFILALQIYSDLLKAKASKDQITQAYVLDILKSYL